MKATEQYVPVELSIVLFKVFLTFEPVDKIRKCRHLNECYWTLLSCDDESVFVHFFKKGNWLFFSSFELKHFRV